MHLLILDFLRRRWWVLALIGLFSALQLASGNSLVVTPFVLLALLVDVGHGLFRTVRPLPVSRRAQATAWWCIAVLLAPLLAAFANPIGAFIYEALYHPIMIALPAAEGVVPTLAPMPRTFDPWFVAVVNVWISLGYAAFAFLLWSALPTTAARTRGETILQGCIGACWGLSMSAPMLFMFILPKTVAAVTGWHWLLFALVPVLALLSYVAAPDVVERRSTVVKAARVLPDAAPVPTTGGLTGAPLLVTMVVFRTLAGLVLVSAVQMLVLRFIGGAFHRGAGEVAAVTRSACIQIGGMAVLLGAAVGFGLEMRSLRVLPMSTARLAALLLSIPAALAVASALLIGFFIALGGGAFPGRATFVAYAFIIAGAGALSIAAFLHASGWRIVPLMLCPALTSVALMFVPGHELPLGMAGAATFAVAAWWLMRGLRRSSTFYRARGLFGLMLGPAASTR